jgi:hypothetical protein
MTWRNKVAVFGLFTLFCLIESACAVLTIDVDV